MQKNPHQHNLELMRALKPSMRYDGNEPFEAWRERTAQKLNSTYEDSIGAIYHCSCNFIPNIRRYFDMGDLAGLIAPRYLVIVCGKDDRIFPLDGVRKTFEIVKTMYRAAGTPGNCTLVVGNEGHRFYAGDAWPVMNAFVRQGNKG
ncbi:MAG: hypothetical protein GX754_06965 [Clostridiaceae bacterium]|nr:hypothetical protein [Clostridiaceae bacterium]